MHEAANHVLAHIGVQVLKKAELSLLLSGTPLGRHKNFIFSVKGRHIAWGPRSTPPSSSHGLSYIATYPCPGPPQLAHTTRPPPPDPRHHFSRTGKRPLGPIRRRLGRLESSVLWVLGKHFKVIRATHFATCSCNLFNFEGI